MGTVDYFEKEWIIENAQIQERKAQRKILFKEIDFLDWCLTEYVKKDDWHMFTVILRKREACLELSYKLGLLSLEEQQDKLKEVIL